MTPQVVSSAASRGPTSPSGAPSNGLQVAIFLVLLGILSLQIFHVSTSHQPTPKVNSQPCSPVVQCASSDGGSAELMHCPPQRECPKCCDSNLPKWEDYRTELRNICGSEKDRSPQPSKHSDASSSKENCLSNIKDPKCLVCLKDPSCRDQCLKDESCKAKYCQAHLQDPTCLENCLKDKICKDNYCNAHPKDKNCLERLPLP